VLARERVERGQVLFGVLEQLAHLRRDLLQALKHARDALLGRVGVLGVEDLSQRGSDQPALITAAVHDHVPGEVFIMQTSA
jgi:hypothetical protein